MANLLKKIQQHKSLLKKGQSCDRRSPSGVSWQRLAVMVKNPVNLIRTGWSEKALEKGIPVLTEVELAYLISDAPIGWDYRIKRKTTTTTMIEKSWRLLVMRSIVWEYWLPASQAAQNSNRKEVLVMELSLFPIDGIDSFFNSEIAVITNLITHIDHHVFWEIAVAAKWNLSKEYDRKRCHCIKLQIQDYKELLSKTKVWVLPFSTIEKVDGAYLKMHSQSLRESQGHAWMNWVFQGATM